MMPLAVLAPLLGYVPLPQPPPAARGSDAHHLRGTRLRMEEALGLNDFLSSHGTRAIKNDSEVNGWTVGLLANRLLGIQADFKNRSFGFTGRQNATVKLDLQFDLGKNGGLFLFGETWLPARKGK